MAKSNIQCKLNWRNHFWSPVFRYTRELTYQCWRGEFQDVPGPFILKVVFAVTVFRILLFDPDLLRRIYLLAVKGEGRSHRDAWVTFGFHVCKKNTLFHFPKFCLTVSTKTDQPMQTLATKTSWEDNKIGENWVEAILAYHLGQIFIFKLQN